MPYVQTYPTPPQFDDLIIESDGEVLTGLHFANNNYIWLLVIGIIALLVVVMPQFQHVPKLVMYNLLLVETTNDMSFSLPETKYDEPFQVIGNISITNLMNQCLSKNLIGLISRSPH